MDFCCWSGAFVAIVTAVVGQISDIQWIAVHNRTNFLCVNFAASIGNYIAGALIESKIGGTPTVRRQK
ncbi:hypothetical protein TMatcc_005533 [Talaromyces marneffei ATCC 18224]